MGEKVPLVLPVRGDLDTASPITDRPLGGLVRARDVHSQRWGPKKGMQSFARAWESPGVASLYDTITLTTGASTFGQGLSYEDQFRDLGTKWTVDLWLQLSSVAYAAAKDEIGLYKFLVNNGGAGVGVIDISILGPNVTDHERVRVEIGTTTYAGAGDAVVGFTGATRLSVGTAQTDKYHVRVVRDGTTATLYLNGVSDGSTTGLSATHGIYGAPGSAGNVTIGTSYNLPDATVTFKGTIYGAWLRDGAFANAPIESVMPCNPHARNVHHAYLGRNIALGGVDHYFDAGRFGAHARMNGAGYTVTASNDNTAPAPASVQGVSTWTTRTNRTATSVLCGGILSTAGVS